MQALLLNPSETSAEKRAPLSEERAGVRGSNALYPPWFPLLPGFLLRLEAGPPVEFAGTAAGLAGCPPPSRAPSAACANGGAGVDDSAAAFALGCAAEASDIVAASTLGWGGEIAVPFAGAEAG